jgi:tetratricopeptide (TPR) repeat protein
VTWTGRFDPRLVIALALWFAPAVAFAHAGVDELDTATRQELARRPDDPQVHLERARVLQMQGEWDAALEQVEAAALRGADPDVVGSTRASIYLDAGFPRMAKVEIDRVLARRPEAAGLLYDRGRAWLALGDREAAARDFGDAVANGPRPTPEQVTSHRDVLLALGKKDDALRALDAGMARVGRVASLELPAVDLEVELGRFDAALARLDRLAATAPPNPLWITRRGEVLERAGRTDAARAEYAKALALIDARPAARRGKPFVDLKRRLETALASAAQRGDDR